MKRMPTISSIKLPPQDQNNEQKMPDVPTEGDCKMDNTESFILPKEEVFMTNLDSSQELAVSLFQQTFPRNK